MVTSSALSRLDRGSSKVTFARIVDSLDQYHKLTAANTDAQLMPSKRLAAVHRLAARIATLCRDWLATNGQGRAAATIRELATAATAEAARLAVIKAKRAATRAKIGAGIVKTKTHDARGKSLAWAGKDDGTLHGKSLHPKYKDEDKKVGWRSKNEQVSESDHIVTHHQTTHERFRNRLRTDNDGDATISNDLLNTGQGSLGWVMDPKSGDVQTFKHAAVLVDRQTGKQESMPHPQATAIARAQPERYQVRTMHHSSPLGGKDVAGAGQLKGAGGKISEISDESGHYTPEAEYTWQAVRAMARGNVPLVDDFDEDEVESAKVKLTGYNQEQGQGKGWIGDFNRGKSDEAKRMFSGDLSLPYQAFLTSHGNEQQMRLKATLAQQIKKREQTPAIESVVPAKEPEQPSGLYATPPGTQGGGLYATPPGTQTPSEYLGLYATPPGTETPNSYVTEDDVTPTETPSNYVTEDEVGSSTPSTYVTQDELTKDDEDENVVVTDSGALYLMG